MLSVLIFYPQIRRKTHNFKYASFAVLNITGRWRDAAFGRAELAHLDVPVAEPA